MLKTPATPNGSRYRRLGTALVALSIVGVLPWTVTAQQATPAKPKSKPAQAHVHRRTHHQAHSSKSSAKVAARPSSERPKMASAIAPPTPVPAAQASPPQAVRYWPGRSVPAITPPQPTAPIAPPPAIGGAPSAWQPPPPPPAIGAPPNSVAPASSSQYRVTPPVAIGAPLDGVSAPRLAAPAPQSVSRTPPNRNLPTPAVPATSQRTGADPFYAPAGTASSTTPATTDAGRKVTQGSAPSASAIRTYATTTPAVQFPPPSPQTFGGGGAVTVATGSGSGPGGGGERRTEDFVGSSSSGAVTVRFVRVDLRTALSEMFQAAKVDFTISSDVRDSYVTCAFHERPILAALGAILSATRQELTFHVEGGIYEIFPREPQE